MGRYSEFQVLRTKRLDGLDEVILVAIPALMALR